MILGIEVTDKNPLVRYNQKCHLGRIIIEDFWETLIIPVDYWTLSDYKRQWKEGLERIKTHDQSCLVASVQDPKKAPLINWWLLYKEKNTIFIQNNLLVDEYYESDIGDKVFSPESCYQFIPPRELPNPDTDGIYGPPLEWVVKLNRIL